MGTQDFYSIKRNVLRVQIFYFLYTHHAIKSWKQAPTVQVPLQWFSWSMLLWVEQAGSLVEPKYLSICLPVSFLHFPSHISGSYLDLGVLHMLDIHINCLDQNLAFNLFVYSDTNSMLGNVDPPHFAMVTSVGHSFLNITHSLDIYTITLLVDFYVGSKGTIPSSPKGLEDVWRVPLLFPFLLVILVNCWKKVVPAKRLNYF